MEEELRLCLECKDKALEPEESKFCMACKKKIEKKYQKRYRHKISNERKQKEEKFPIWTCDNGHVNQLTFNPIQHKRLWAHYECIEENCVEKPVK